MAKENIREMTHENVGKIMDKAKHMKESDREEMAHLKEKASIMKDNLKRYIQGNPEKSLLIAAGIGAAIGALFTAMMMKGKK